MKKKTERIEYNSSSVNSSSYNFETKELIIYFQTKTGYSYENVELEDYIGFSQAESIGKSFNQFIRNKYETKKFEGYEELKETFSV